MSRLQKVGGVAALLEALAYGVGFAVLATVLDPGQMKTWTPVQKLGFMLERRTFFHLWSLFIGVLGSTFLVLLAVALHERLKGQAESMMKVATSFGLIWAGLVMAGGMIQIVGLKTLAKLHAQDPAQATTVWRALSAVEDGLAGGVEFIGGLWVVLVSLAAHRGGLPRGLVWFGHAVGAAGILSVAPGLDGLVEVFGLTQIAWFFWIGWVLLRRPCPTEV